MRDVPSDVREYSTHGGFSETTVLRTRPSASSSFSCLLSMLDVADGIRQWISPNLRLPSISAQSIRALYFPPMSSSVVTMGIALYSSSPDMGAPSHGRYFPCAPGRRTSNTARPIREPTER